MTWSSRAGEAKSVVLGARSERRPGMCCMLPFMIRPRALVLLLAVLLGVLSGPASAEARMDAYALDLYAPGVFSTQATRTWCIGASIQMMLNLIRHERDHSQAGQQRYIGQQRYMWYARSHDLMANSEAGSDPVGWAATLDHFSGGSDYRAAGQATFRRAPRAVALALRRTGLPVGLVVNGGGHAWVMTGFTATGDPATDPEPASRASGCSGRGTRSRARTIPRRTRG
jgi:hypothetical protein